VALPLESKGLIVTIEPPMILCFTVKLCRYYYFAGEVLFLVDCFVCNFVRCLSVNINNITGKRLNYRRDAYRRDGLEIARVITRQQSAMGCGRGLPFLTTLIVEDRVLYVNIPPKCAIP